MVNFDKQFVDGVMEGDNPNDWQYGAIGINVDDLEDLNGRLVGQINQGKYAKSKSACTIVGAYKDLCYLWDKECTEIEMLEVIDYCSSKGGYKVGQGRFIFLAMKNVLDWRNSKYKDKLSSYFQIKRTDADFDDVLNKGQILGCTYKGNGSYNSDYMGDLVLNGTQFGASTYGHRPSLRKVKGKIVIEDNYGGSGRNTYELEHFKELIQNNVYSGNFYLFTKQVSSLEEISRLNKMLVNCQTIMSAVSVNKVLSNNPIYQEECQEERHKNNDKAESIKQRLLNLK